MGKGGMRGVKEGQVRTKTKLGPSWWLRVRTVKPRGAVGQAVISYTCINFPAGSLTVSRK